MPGRSSSGGVIPTVFKIKMINQNKMKTKKHTEEWKKQNSIRLKEQYLSGKRISYFKGKSLMKGKHHTEETKNKISQIKKTLYLKGKLKGVFTKGHRTNVGRKCKEETKNKIGKANSIKTKEYFIQHPDFMKERIKLMQTPEARKKMANSISKKWQEGKYPESTKRGWFTTERVSGEKNTNWLGGKSFEPYTFDFSTPFKNSIRRRDNQLCMNCGVHREKLNRALAVHHINYDKKLSIPENCISLCIKCHCLTNFNRVYWTKLFQDKLTKFYNYQYEGENILINFEEVKNGI